MVDVLNDLEKADRGELSGYCTLFNRYLVLFVMGKLFDYIWWLFGIVCTSVEVFLVEIFR